MLSFAHIGRRGVFTRLLLQGCVSLAPRSASGPAWVRPLDDEREKEALPARSSESCERGRRSPLFRNRFFFAPHSLSLSFSFIFSTVPHTYGFRHQHSLSQGRPYLPFLSVTLDDIKPRVASREIHL